MILKRIETFNILTQGKRVYDLAPLHMETEPQITVVTGGPASGKTMLGVLLNEINKFILGGGSRLQSLAVEFHEWPTFSLLMEDSELTHTFKRLDVTFDREYLRKEQVFSSSSPGNMPEKPVYEWRGYYDAFVSHAAMYGVLSNQLENWCIAAGNMPVRGPAHDAALLETLLKLVDPQVKSVKASNDSNRFIVIEHARRGPIVLVDGELREVDKQTMSRSMTDMLDIARVIERMEEPGLFYIDERLSNLSYRAAKTVIEIIKQRLKKGSHLIVTAKHPDHLPINLLDISDDYKLEVNNDM